jgi:hypothetical protein
MSTVQDLHFALKMLRASMTRGLHRFGKRSFGQTPRQGNWDQK